MYKALLALGIGALMADCTAYGSLRTGYLYNIDMRDETDVIFVLDISGSMEGQTGTSVEQRTLGRAEGKVSRLFGGGVVGNTVQKRLAARRKKINEAKREIVSALKGLSNGATFNLIFFSGDVHPWKPQPVEATSDSVHQVQYFLHSLKAGGGTNLLKAVEKAMDYRPKTIVVVSDGRPTSSTPQQILDAVKAKNGDGEITFHTVGIGEDHDILFMRNLAKNNGGIYVPR